MHNVSHVAGYFASTFAISLFVLATHLEASNSGWIHVVIGWCMTLAAFSGVVCLVSVASGFVGSREKNSN